jgi:hypothetical protein
VSTHLKLLYPILCPAVPKIVPLLYATAYRLMRLGMIYESFEVPLPQGVGRSKILRTGTSYSGHFWQGTHLGILAAILAPTDAGLGQVIVNSPRVPMRIRDALNVEAGLNDGLSVPFLLFFMALAAARIEGGRRA